MKINKIGVIGAGTMGSGIAQLFALYNYPVIVVDKERSILEGAQEKIKKWTEPELWNKVSGLIELTTDMDKLKDCDLIIEAVFEEMEIKREVFNTLNNICKKDAVLATNTSSLSINKLSKFIDYPVRFIGMHFMNPPRVMKLIEIVKGEKTSDETVKTITEFTKEIGKVPALVNDSPGFISNRLLFALIGEAMRLLEKGVAKKKDIDTVMKYGMNHPMGPIELADFIGLDVCHKIMLSLYESLGDERYKPIPLLESLVKEGKLGRKTKEGFYKYP
ncbi:MAG: 3-hydroxyacyl-CoA dehydrogenase family protein [Nitrospinota bacterium]